MLILIQACVGMLGRAMHEDVVVKNLVGFPGYFQLMANFSVSVESSRWKRRPTGMQHSLHGNWVMVHISGTI